MRKAKRIKKGLECCASPVTIEKVMKALEECTTDGKCTKCVCGTGHPTLVCVELLKDVRELLKEQEAVSITTDYFDGFGNRTSHCPSCNSRLVWHQNKNYCGECGQAVKWE